MSNRLINCEKNVVFNERVAKLNFRQRELKMILPTKQVIASHITGT
jgi:hypothetical protein